MSHGQSHPRRLDETLSRMNIRGLGLWSAGYLTLPARVLWRERTLDERITGFVRELGRILTVMIRPVPGDFTITEGYNGPQEFVDSVAEWLATFDIIGRAANVTYIWICHFWARLLDHALEGQPVWTKDDLDSLSRFVDDMNYYDALLRKERNGTEPDLLDLARLILPHAPITEDVIGEPLSEELIRTAVPPASVFEFLFREQGLLK